MMTVIKKWEEMEYDFEGNEQVCLWNANNAQTIGIFDTLFTPPAKYWDLLVVDSYTIDDNIIILEVVDERDL